MPMTDHLRPAREDEFDRVFSLLEASFPADEYRPCEAQKALLNDPRYTIYVLPDPRNHCPIAFVTLWRFTDFAFIEHLAVDPDYRNLGLGSMILNEVAKLEPGQLCLEAELPETELARRRIAFYNRNGFCSNPFPYLQPPYSSDRNPIPLVFMTAAGTVSAGRFAAMRDVIFREVYKQ